MAAAALALATVHWNAIKQRLHDVDTVVFHEAFKDAAGRLIAHEDWSRVAPFTRRQDYGWLAQRAPLVAIAHALGETTGEANSLEALRRSVGAGFTFFEVDLWLEGDRVRCFHGPEAPPPLARGGCTFDALMDALPKDAWLVLDIKSDFQVTGARIIESLHASGRADHVIFQLYLPEQIAMFNRWQATLPLPGPIVTIYNARRSATTIAEQSARFGARALTLPMSRLAGFERRPDALAVFVHPIDDCASLDQARAAGVRGVYMENNLGCAGMPSISRNLPATR